MTVHRFLRVEFSPIPLTRWRCVNGRLKVGSTIAAKQLEGLPCR